MHPIAHPADPKRGLFRMNNLLSRLVRPRPRADHLTFTVYSRRECCCCHKAIDLLKKYQNKYKFNMNTVNIDADPDLVALYDQSVPVVAVDGKVRFRGVVNPVLLERLLNAESRRA